MLPRTISRFDQMWELADMMMTKKYLNWGEWRRRWFWFYWNRTTVPWADFRSDITRKHKLAEWEMPVGHWRILGEKKKKKYIGNLRMETMILFSIFAWRIFDYFWISCFRFALGLFPRSNLGGYWNGETCFIAIVLFDLFDLHHLHFLSPAHLSHWLDLDRVRFACCHPFCMLSSAHVYIYVARRDNENGGMLFPAVEFLREHERLVICWSPVDFGWWADAPR
jgi:hypothetical protein